MMARNPFRDPGFRDWDLSVTKNFLFGERLKAQFRAELFNVSTIRTSQIHTAVQMALGRTIRRPRVTLAAVAQRPIRRPAIRSLGRAGTARYSWA